MGRMYRTRTAEKGRAMRDVTIDEVFTWREEFGVKAKEAIFAQNMKKISKG